ncbi:MAG: class I SAM-dependent methyltransferase [Bacteroidetes bacterium]|nr:class I SAM-dependent methyltransferase [Bacteroidota bacterium]
MDLKETNGILNTTLRRHPWERARVAVTAYFINKFLYRKEGPVHVLDIGSGDLYQAKMLVESRENFHVTGLDTGYSEEEIRAVKESRWGKRLNAMRDPEEITRGPVISLVMLMDVIEHVEKDREFLEKWVNNAVIGKDTLFFITVPAHQSLFSYHDSYLGHYRRYSEKDLILVCTSSGLKVVGSGYLFFSLWLMRVLQFRVEKMLGVNRPPASDLSEWKGRRWTANLITWFLTADFRVSRFLQWAGIRITGLSAYALCKKA